MWHRLKGKAQKWGTIWKELKQEDNKMNDYIERGEQQETQQIQDPLESRYTTCSM